MSQSQYLENTRDAAQTLIVEIWRERRAIDELETRIATNGRLVEAMYDQFRAVEMDEDDFPGGAQRAFEIMHQVKDRIEPDQNRLKSEITRLSDESKDRRHSIGALSGALLQVAKQGISSAFGKVVSNAPEGRRVGTQPLRDVVWQGRNQSLHHEEGMYSNAVVDCFNRLHADFMHDFDLASHMTENFAFNVVQLLAWKSIDAYERDMRSVLGDD